MAFNTLEEFNKNVEMAYNYEQHNNKIYREAFLRLFKSTLTDDDVRSLENIGSLTFDFNVIRPRVLQSLKNVKISIPSVTIKALNHSSNEINDNINKTGFDPDTIALILNQELEHIRKANKYANAVFNVALDVFCGGKGVFLIKTDWANKFNFDQKFIIKEHKRPDKVFFDRSTEDLEKKRFVFELEEIYEEEFTKLFPNINIDTLETKNNVIEWIKRENTTDSTYQTKNRRIITICYYFYKKEYSKKKIYLLNGDKMVTNPPKNKKNIKKERTIIEYKIMRVAFVGNTKLMEEETNFYNYPFIECRGETYREKDDKINNVPYIKHALDGQRSMNFMANFFLDEGVNNRSKLTIINDGVDSQGEEALREQNKNIILRYKDFERVEGTDTIVEHSKPEFKSSTPLNVGYLEGLSKLQDLVAKSLGADVPSLSELSQMSGKGLYNLSDFMSAPNEIFMQHLEEAIYELHNVILKSMPDICVPRTIKLKLREKLNIKEFNFEFDADRFHVYIEPGVNYKLQQEATIDKITDLAERSATWQQFISSPDGTLLLLENLDLNNKAQWLDKFKIWIEQQEQKSQQNNQEQLAQQDMQNKTMQSQAKLMDAQTNAKSLMLKQQTSSVEAATKKQAMDLEAIELSHKIDNDTNTKEIELKRLAQDDRHKRIDSIHRLEAFKASLLK